MTTKSAPGAASVEFSSVTKRYGPVVAVDAISFRIEPGSLVTLLGPSGCGKTTTLRMIAGLEFASEGRITIGERDVTKLSASERDVSMVFQSYALFPHMTVLDNVAYGPSVSGAGKAQAREMARAKLELVGLRDLDQRMPSELSGGQQQRVAVARALVLEPEVLLFDEPLSNLDAKLRRRVREDIRELQQSLKLTVVYVTHDQEEALAVSDRVIVMSNARIAQEGPPRALYEEPANLFVADFIGDANVVDGEIVTVANDRASVRLGGIAVAMPSRGQTAGPVKIAIRPEALTLDPPDGEALEGIVEKAAYLGPHMEYSIETAIGSLFVVDRDVMRPRSPGQAVRIGFAGHGMAVVPT